MKNWVHVFLALVMTVMCCMSIVQPAYAAELPSVSIPVSIKLTGTLPTIDEDYTVVLVPEPENADYPMPQGASDGAYVLTITGEDTRNIPAITFDRVGVYTYKIYQVAGTNKKCTYDKSIYTLIVTITNTPDYKALEATVALYEDSGDTKVTEVEFINKYPWVIADTPQTGDESSPMLYALLAVASVGVIMGLFLTRKRNTCEE